MLLKLPKYRIVKHWKDTGLSFTIVEEPDGVMVTIGKNFPGHDEEISSKRHLTER